jgi:pyruvate dehydrogenase E2 component (dihydrolipoamide acetyltransferase)
MSFEFKLPDIGEGLTEGEVTKWLVSEGQRVREDEPMVEILTDKATAEITSPRTGVIEKILVPAGTKVPVGTVLVVIGEGGGGGGKAAPAAAAAPAAKAAATARAAAGAPASGHAVPAARPAAPARASAPAQAAARAGAPAQGGDGEASGNGAIDPNRVVLAAPATRYRARELGIDLRTVPGTGPNGRITRTDLETFAEGGARAAARAPSPAAPSRPGPATPKGPPVTVPVFAPTVSAEDEHVPLKGLRGKIAEQMLRSKQHSPHFTFADECDVTNLVKLREEAKGLAEERGVKLTYLPFVMKALVAAFRRFPTVNAVVDDTANEYVIRREYNVGIATDTEDGLTVPVVKHVDRLTILQIAAEVQRLTEAARSKKIALADLKGGTFTITSAGSIGGILATPILNYPEVGILGVYKIADRAVVRDGQVVVRKIMNLTITLDHRIVDGATAARFLNLVIQYLETPNLLLLEGI